MQKGKSEYHFSIDPSFISRADEIILNWLKINDFTWQNKYGENLYYNYDAIVGNRCFQYRFDGNIVHIYAWIVGVGKKFYKLEGAPAVNMAVSSYTSILNELFRQLSAAQNPQGMPNENPYAGPDRAGSLPDAAAYHNTARGTGYTGPSYRQDDIGNTAQNMTSQAERRNEKLCVISFFLSILGLILALSKTSYGAIIYVLVYMFAVMGLKTKKKPMAIAAIIIASVSIAVVIFQVIYYYNMYY